MEEKDVLEIISKLRSKGREWNTVDAKRELTLTGNGEKAEFVKDVVAMANNLEKSYLIVGLVDQTFEATGTLSRHYQKSDLNQLLSDKIDPPLTVDYQEFTINGDEYGIIEIMGYNPPYIVARDLIAERTDRKQIRIYKGTIFVRHEDTTEGITRTELEELLRKKAIRQEFDSETEYAQQLVFERPFAWEYKLTAELLRTKLVPIKRKLTDLQRGLAFKKTTIVQGVEAFWWIQTKCTDAGTLLQVAGTVINEEIPLSWGEPGVSGDPLAIKHTVEKLVTVCSELVEWEAEVHFTTVSPIIEGIRQKMEHWTSQPLQEISSAPERLMEPFNQPNPKGVYNIQLIFSEPTGVNEVLAQLNSIQRDPQKMMQLFSGF